MHFSNYFSGPPHLQTCSTAYDGASYGGIAFLTLLKTLDQLFDVMGIIWPVSTLLDFPECFVVSEVSRTVVKLLEKGVA